MYHCHFVEKDARVQKIWLKQVDACRGTLWQHINSPKWNKVYTSMLAHKGPAWHCESPEWCLFIYLFDRKGPLQHKILQLNHRYLRAVYHGSNVSVAVNEQFLQLICTYTNTDNFNDLWCCKNCIPISIRKSHQTIKAYVLTYYT